MHTPEDLYFTVESRQFEVLETRYFIWKNDSSNNWEVDISKIITLKMIMFSFSLSYICFVLVKETSPR